MPEGDTLYRIAANLRKAMLGRTVTQLDSVLDSIRDIGARRGAAGRLAHAVEARGKHLLIQMRKPETGRQMGESDPISCPEQLQLDLIRSDLVLHTHLRMTGSWHIYRPGEAWQKPARYARCVLHTDAFVFPCFSAPVVELLTAREAARHEQLIQLGPDAITEDFDADSALANLRRHADVQIGVALMNQRSIAGIGNVFKSEIMFIQRVWPWTRVCDLCDDELMGLIAKGHELLKLNRFRGDRDTRFTLNARDHHWVYGRTGRPCKACGTLIRSQRQGLDGRTTYFCPICQSANSGPRQEPRR